MGGSTFLDFSGVQLTCRVLWDQTSTIYNTSHYDSVQRQRFYTSVIQLGISIRVRALDVRNTDHTAMSLA